MIDEARRLLARLGSIIGVLVAWGVFFFGSPLLVPAAMVTDMVHDRDRMRWLRLYGFVLGLLTNEVAGLIVLFVQWVVTGFGLFIRTGWAQRLNAVILRWWVNNVMVMVCFFMDTRLVTMGVETLKPAPVVVLARHISFLDAAIPAVLVSKDAKKAPPHVFMRELRFDPCIEISARRSPNYFVDRSGGAKELASIERLGAALPDGASGVIFPEGGFRTETRFRRAVESLQRKMPELVSSASSLRFVMPPRPGGTWAFLQGAAGVDVAVIAHAGFEPVSSVADIVRNCPLGLPVLISVRRIPREEVPSDESAFTRWLFEQFRWVDDFAALYDRTVRS